MSRKTKNSKSKSIHPLLDAAVACLSYYRNYNPRLWYAKLAPGKWRAFIINTKTKNILAKSDMKHDLLSSTIDLKDRIYLNNNRKVI